MHFRIDDAFRDNLARLTNEEQKAVKTTFFDLISKRHGRGLRLKKLRGGNWSARVNHDLRIIADWNERENDLRLRYVGRHDEAYEWARRHRTEVHAGNDVPEDAEAAPSVGDVADPESTQRKKTVGFRLLSAARAFLNPFANLHDAIEKALDEEHGRIGTENRIPPKGAAEVRKLFEISNVGTVAGCYVLEGKIACDDQIRIIRGGETVYKGMIDSLHRRKKSVREIRRKDECGIGVWNYPNIQVGDRIESY